jgi:hypothetical protein
MIMLNSIIPDQDIQKKDVGDTSLLWAPVRSSLRRT